ncbi:hypothetical protein GC722_08020 [Auraticoccus sp. F435]|uniref:Uncharacterized protein n=1 Tax=Auraticoccus cholistanensis TaxID=2656650 RepID=A0A6A9UTJ3_9ACTN|nr:hypothetical protein [Auraticoccus cholistanensis]MVA75968.1 hypothetical protein [Auraticoccus cholistanensis]
MVTTPTPGTLLVLVPHSTAWLFVTAALRAGLLGHPERLVLVTTSQSGVPEAGDELRRTLGWDRLNTDVDVVLDHDELVAPHHPLGWTPTTPAELARWRELLLQRAGLGGGPVRLLLRDLHLAPARTLAAALPEAAVDVYAEDLSAWAATPTVLEPSVAGRVGRLLHVDLWPGLIPRLLAETGCRPVALDPAQLRALAGEVAPPSEPGRGRVAVLVEEDLAGLGLDEEEVAALVARQLAAAHAAGADRVRAVRDPLPALGSDSEALAEAGLVELDEDAVPLAAVLAADPVVVVGCRSTLLLTAGVPAVAVQPEGVLERLRPWAHPSRLPLVLTALRCGPDAPAAGLAEVQQLVDALAHTTQPALHPAGATPARALAAERPGLAERFLLPGNPLVGSAG